jgi:gas vesicle protein
MRTILGSIIGGIIALIGAYFKGKSVAKEEVRVNNLENVIENQNEIKKVQKRVIKNKSSSRVSKLNSLRKTITTKDNK